MNKPLGHKAYTSIGHLPGSRTGSADRHIPDSQARLCLEGPLPHLSEVIVQEKMDGSCVCAARIHDRIVALGRQGDLANASRTPIRRLWAKWVEQNESRFMAALQNGERLVGEWLPIAHDTQYTLDHEPFVVFDWFAHHMTRGTYDELCERATLGQFITPPLIRRGAPINIDQAMAKLAQLTQAQDTPEGAIWRVEGRHSQSNTRQVKVIAKYVREDKTPGALLPEHTGLDFVWNTFPEQHMLQSIWANL